MAIHAGSLLIIATALASVVGPVAAFAEPPGPPPPGKGRIVVFRPSMFAGAIGRGWPVKVDGQNVGNLKAGTYVVADRAPGAHVVSMELWDEPGVSARRVSVAAGKTAYFRLEIKQAAKNAYLVGSAFGIVGYAIASNVAAKQNPTGLYDFVTVNDGKKATAELKKAEN